MRESLEQEIRTLRSLFWSDRDPDGRVFAPLADAHRRAGAFTEAQELLTEGLSRHPDFATGHVVAARLYLGQGMQNEAERSARRALELDAENVIALSALADVLESSGAAEEAAQIRATLQQLDPEADEARVAQQEASAARRLAETRSVGTMKLELSTAEAVVAETEPGLELAETALDLSALTVEPALSGSEVDLAVLAPDETLEEPVMELADLAPDEEPVMELADLAPDEEPTRERRPAEPMRTRTLAELYVKQGFVDKALEVLRHLRAANPGATDLDERIAQLERGEGAPRPAATTTEPSAQDAENGLEPEEEVETLARDLAESGHEGHDVDTPFAWAPAESEGGDEDRGGDGIGAYFDRLLGWEPRERS